MYNSHGIIAYKIVTGEPKYILSQRRNSLTLIYLLRSCHKLTKDDITRQISKLPKEETERLLNFSFDEIWDDLYLEKTNRIYVTESHRARQNYKFLVDNFMTELENQTKNTTVFCEWGVPKGRRKYQETGFVCAEREWLEETNIPSDNLYIINTLPFYYNLVYGNKEVCVECWLAEIKTDVEIVFQKSHIRDYISEEVGLLKWCSLSELEPLVNSSIYKTFTEIDNFVRINLV